MSKSIPRRGSPALVVKESKPGDAWAAFKLLHGDPKAMPGIDLAASGLPPKRQRKKPQTDGIH
jgi:hypothetical protein